MNLKHLSEKELLSLSTAISKELITRGVIRTRNNIVSGYGEHVAKERLKLTLAPNSAKGYDALDSKGKRYQIKARQLIDGKGSRQLGVIRNLKERPFDFLIGILFDDDFDIKEMWLIPYEVVKKYPGRFSAHQNGNIIQLKGAILKDRRVKRIV